MIIITGHIRLAPENIEKARPHMRTVLETTRKEKGCQLYAFGEDVLDPGLIRIVERWDDWASLEAHAKSDHLKAWGAFTRELGLLEREVWAHEGANGKKL